MDTSKKMQMRLWLWLFALFIIAAIGVGPMRAALLSLAALAAWKAYSYFKLKKFWDQQPDPAKQTIEYATSLLNKQKPMNSLWVDVLARSDMRKVSTDYRVQLMAEAIICEKEDPVESWTQWGASRMDVHIRNLPEEELAENFASEGVPQTVHDVMISRVAFEVIVAEHALRLHGIAEPRAAIAQRTTRIMLERYNRVISAS